MGRALCVEWIREVTNEPLQAMRLERGRGLFDERGHNFPLPALTKRRTRRRVASIVSDVSVGLV